MIARLHSGHTFDATGYSTIRVGDDTFIAVRHGLNVTLSTTELAITDGSLQPVPCRVHGPDCCHPQFRERVATSWDDAFAQGMLAKVVP